MAYNLNYFSDDEKSEWLANSDPHLFVKSNVEKQLDDSEIEGFGGKRALAFLLKSVRNAPNFAYSFGYVGQAMFCTFFL